MENININLKNANALTKIWLYKLFDGEINETNSAIENENIWLNGSDNNKSISIHIENLNCLKEYKIILENVKNQIEESM